MLEIALTHGEISEIGRCFATETMKEFFDKWSEVQNNVKPGMQTVGSIQQRIAEELQILNALSALGCRQIPGEAFDVPFMIEDRHRLLQEMRDSLS